MGKTTRSISNRETSATNGASGTRAGPRAGRRNRFSAASLWPWSQHARERARHEELANHDILARVRQAPHAASITELIRAASRAELVALGQDIELVAWLLGQTRADERTWIVDTLFDAADDITIMQWLFEARFAVSVGSGGDPQALAWMPGGAEVVVGPSGLRRVYNVLKDLPARHVATLTHVMFESIASGQAAEGTASSTRPYLRLRYDESRTQDIESGAYTHPGDRMRGMNIMDTTTVHELAHRVDHRGRYSSKASFRALSGWTHYPPGQSEEIVAAMVAAMVDPLPADLTATEHALAMRAAELALRARRATVAAMREDVTRAYGELGLDPLGSAAGTRPYRGDVALFHALATTNLLIHIAAGSADNWPWYKEPFSYLGQRQFHEAYKNEGWWSYENPARDERLSIYQFRDPGEEFAELYATYHCTEPKGLRVPAVMRVWFEDEGLHCDIEPPPSRIIMAASQNPVMDARAALVAYLGQCQPGVAFDIEPMDVHVPGWSFFTGTQESVRDGNRFYWVVRADGTVVTSDPRAELARIYQSLDICNPETRIPPRVLAWIALALLGRNVRLVDEERMASMRGMDLDERLAPPLLEHTEQGVRLVFWDVTDGRGLYLSRHCLRIDRQYRISYTKHTPRLHRG